MYGVGTQGYRRALGSLAEMVDTSAVPVVNFADYEQGPIWQEIIEFQRAIGIVHPDFKFPWVPKYWLSERDRHLNAEGHIELGRLMLEGLRECRVCLPPTDGPVGDAGGS